MRITDIKITNYRAFYGEHHIQLIKNGKNLMLYSKNESGKSSLFIAMNDFFLESVNKLPEYNFCAKTCHYTKSPIVDNNINQFIYSIHP